MCTHAAPSCVLRLLQGAEFKVGVVSGLPCAPACLYTSLCRTVRVSGVCALLQCGRVSLALCRWRLSVPVARTAPPPPPHRLFSQNALQFIKQYWKMHGRPLFLVLIREDNIRYVEERGEA